MQDISRDLCMPLLSLHFAEQFYLEPQPVIHFTSLSPNEIIWCMFDLPAAKKALCALVSQTCLYRFEL